MSSICKETVMIHLPPKPFQPNTSDREILEKVNAYPYITSRQLAKLLYTPSYIRERCKALVDHEFLHGIRAPRPFGMGSSPLHFVLARAGRQYLRQRQVTLTDYIRPSELLQNPDHTRAVNEVYVLAALLQKRLPEMSLVRFIHERECKRRKLKVVVSDHTESGTTERTVSLIPDGIWQIATPHKRNPYTIALEVDCGTLTDQWKWRRKIAGYLALLAGAWQTDSYPDFLIDNLTIAIVAMPGEKRASELRQWTYAELAARGETECPNFLFLAGDPATMQPLDSFFAPGWHLPYSAELVASDHTDGLAFARHTGLSEDVLPDLTQPVPLIPGIDLSSFRPEPRLRLLPERYASSQEHAPKYR